MPEINKKLLWKVFLGVGGCIFLYWILHETTQAGAFFSFIGGIVSPFITGAAIAFVLNVPMRAIEGLFKKINNLKFRRLLAIIMTFIVILLVLALVFVLLIPQVIDTVESLIPQLQKFVENAEDKLYSFLAENPDLMEWVTNSGLGNIDWAGLVEKALTVVGNSLSTILGGTFSAIGVVAGFFVDLIIAIVFAVYCLFQKEILAKQGRKLMYSIFPEKFSDEFIRILRLSNSTFSNFLSGQCIEVVILGVMFAIAMAIFKMPYIPLVSVLVAVTAFIPVVGAFVGCFIGAFLILVNDPLQALIFVAMFLVIQQIEGNLIYPKVVGTSIGLSGMWVLLAVSVGGSLFGIAGMFLMIPVVSVIYTLLREFTDNRLKARQIEPQKLMPQPPELKSQFKENRDQRRKDRAVRKMKKNDSSQNDS